VGNFKPVLYWPNDTISSPTAKEAWHGTGYEDSAKHAWHYTKKLHSMSVPAFSIGAYKQCTNLTFGRGALI